MSHSVFKEFPSTGDLYNKAQSGGGDSTAGLDLATGSGIGLGSGTAQDNVVIVLNKDGSVSVDQHALHTFLRDDAGKTSVSVVRVQSPTPSLEQELRERGEESFDEDYEDSASGGDEANDSDSGGDDSAEDEDGASDEEEDADELGSSGEEENAGGDCRRRTGRKGKNSTRRRKNRREREKVPHVRLTVEQYLAPEQAKQFAAEILQYAGMSSGLSLDVDYDYQRFVVQNDHCYTPLTSPKQKQAPPVAVNPPKAETAAKPKPRGRKAVEPKVTSRRGRPKATPVIEIASEEDEEKAEEENEDDAEAGEEETEDDDFSVTESDRSSDLDFKVNSNYLPKKKKKKPHSERDKGSGRGNSAKSRESTGSAPRKPRGSTTGRQIEDRQLNQAKLPFKSSPKTGQLTALQKIQQKHHLYQSQRPRVSSSPSTLPRKERPTVPPSTASTPVVAASPKQENHRDPSLTDMSALFANPDLLKKSNLPAKKEESSPAPPQTAIQLPSAFELDLISSIVAEDDDVMETRGKSNAADKSVAEDPLDLNDTSILDDIVGDDGLPDELMQHVAELVENKSLQEVIDKQVLGVEDPMAHLTNLLPKTQTVAVNPAPTPPQPKKESPFVKLAQQKQLAKASAAAAASLTAPRKEPIKIVRSDGRVITLPPIEAPTTRGAKRRAQSSTDAPPASESPSPVLKIKEEPESHMVEILSAKLLPESAAAAVVGCKKSGSDRGSTSRRASTTPSLAESEMDMEFNSEDDPDRLWCVCKQPHNNRFMICCDTCEDWFHGKCVNITKAMGQQMEAAGKEWTCPNCVLGLTGTDQVCMVCHKQAKPDSVYCSDECIVKHATRTQSQQQPQSTSPLVMPGKNAATPRVVVKQEQATGTPPAATGEVKRIGLLKNAQGRVIVYHKRTKVCLSGDSAPFLANIKEWLAQNPDYEIVAPGSEVAEAFKAKQAQLQQMKVKQLQLKQQQQQLQQQGRENSPGTGEKIQAKLKFGPNKQMVIVHPKTAQQIKVANSGKSSPTTTTTPLKVVRKSGEGSAAAASPGAGTKPVQRGEVEPIRLTVRKTLKEHLAQRMLEVRAEGAAKLSAEEIEQFALDTEQEMFALFSRDTGHKYKAKYRSLVFNIKDRKNETLFRKICEKGVKPYRLVRMSPEELASQELAQWRENENKHQLEMIKKSEMDLLACAKSYVLKSHKGEEVLEDVIGDTATVDDVTMFGGMGVKEEEQEVKKEGERKRERSRERDKHRSHHSSSSSSSSKHHHKRRRSRERSRDKDKDKDKDKERSRDKERSSGSKHKSTSSSSSSHHHHSSSSSSSSRDKSKKETSSSSSRHHHHHHSSSHHGHHKVKEESNHSSSPASTSSASNHKSSASGEGHVFKPSQREAEESYDLIEKILQETSPELAAKLHEQKSIEAKAAKEVKVEQLEDEEYNPESADPLREVEEQEELQEEQELSAVKGIWSGRVAYQEISQFQGVMLPLYGETADCLSDFPTSFEVQGRIGPDVVWDYLGKIKRSVNRDITVVRFVPKTQKDQAAYDTMYSYFETKGRLGVLKPKSEVIKDFYLVPQKKGKLLPSVLLTLKGLGSYETRANCIVGIVVKATLKRPSGSAGGGGSAKVSKKTPVTIMRTEATPPGSPKVSSAHKLLEGLPIIGGGGSAVARKTDDDEPYSPGGSDEDDSAMDTIPAGAAVATTAGVVVPSELQKEVERLNRQIEAQKNEIVEMLSKDPLAEEPYSPSRPVSPKDKVSSIPLADISIPSNLQEILASLKNVTPATNNVALEKMQVAEVEEEDEDEEYNPLPISASKDTGSTTYKPRPTSPSTRAYLLAQQQNSEEIPFLSSTSSAGDSKLAHMTEAELMSLVPDGVDLAPPPPKKSVDPDMPPGLGDGNDEEYDPGE